MGNYEELARGILRDNALRPEHAAMRKIAHLTATYLGCGHGQIKSSVTEVHIQINLCSQNHFASLLSDCKTLGLGCSVLSNAETPRGFARAVQIALPCTHDLLEMIASELMVLNKPHLTRQLLKMRYSADDLPVDDTI